MTTEETNRLLARLAQSEDAWVERKQSYDEQEVRRTVVGFANSLTEGQTALMFIGADNKGKHKGVQNADGLQKKLGGIMKRCYPPIAYQTCVLPVEVDGAKLEVLIILVPYSKDGPHFAGPAYIRQGSETKEASREVFDELVSSRNDKTRRILQFKGKKAWLRVVSKSGFWYEHEGVVEFCDALTFRFTRKDGPNTQWAFPVPEIEIQQEGYRELVVTAKADCPEDEHIRTMVLLWSEVTPRPQPGEHSLPPRHHPTLRQFLASPALALPAVAALADGSKDPRLPLLLLDLRFALKKSQNPLSREQKLYRLHETHQAILGDFAKRGWNQVWGPGYETEVKAAIDFSTSVEEAKEFLEIVIKKNRPEVQTEQRRCLLRELGLPRAEPV